MDAGSVALRDRIAERAARTESAPARRWLAFLAEAGDLLAGSLDYETTLSSVARLVVPEMADWCAVDILEENILWPVLLEHPDPSLRALGSELRQRYPTPEGLHSPMWTALRTGKAVLVKHVTETLVANGIPEEDPRRELAQGLECKSAMYVPLRARGRVLGVLTFASAESGATYDVGELEMAEELAGRCALALDSALVHAQLKQALSEKDEALREREKLLRELEVERQRLEVVLRQVPSGVLMVETGSGRILFANPRAEELFGYRLSTKGFPGPEVFHGFKTDGGDYRVEDFPLSRSAQTGEVVVGEELIFERHDKSRVRLIMSSLPLKDAEGRRVAALAAFEDVTGVRAAEEDALRQARFLEQFIGILGHDLRNPLQAIRGSAQVLSRKPLAEAEQRNVRRITGATERMSRMITDLLDFTRSRLGGGIPMKPREVRLKELVREIVEELEAAFPNGKIEWSVGEDVRGVWDQDRIAQVLQNLMANALQYGGREAPVRLAVREEGDEVVLTVHNEGEPIAPQTLSQIFEPFRRGPQGSGEKASGLGLGLYIARQIILAHGGQVEVASTGDAGTTVTVRMPRQSTAVDAQVTP